MDRIADVLRSQDQLIGRAQALERGVVDDELRRWVSQRRLVVVHPGVYAAHAGELSWNQRAWAGVLAAWPAALSHESALRAANGPGRRDSPEAGPIHVTIGQRRRLVVPDGVILHRTGDLSSTTEWNRSPPRVRMEEAVVDIAVASRSDFEAVTVLARAISQRQSTAPRLLRALASRGSGRRRSFLAAVLTDVEQGRCTVLEHDYATRVESAHGLPVAMAQPIELSRGILCRELRYDAYGLVVELDSGIFRSGVGRRDADPGYDRDIEVPGKVRAGWAQVHLSSCRTAAGVAVLLRRLGWTGEPVTCSACTPGDWRVMDLAA